MRASTRVCVIAGSLLFAPAWHIRAQDSKDFLLAARRTGVAELIDPATLETISRIHFDFHVERLAASADGSTLYVDGYYGEGGCCEHYALDLKTLKLREPGPTEGIEPHNSIRSSDGRWLFQLRSFRGLALKIFDGHTGESRELIPRALPVTEDDCGGNWAAEGAWSGARFYFYVECPKHPGLVWTVSPEDRELGESVLVAPFAEAPGCQHPLPVVKMFVAAGGELLLYESFGSKADRTAECQTELPGGAWILDSATGRLTRQIGAGFHFNWLIPDRSGSLLYGVDPGNAAWGGPVRLVVLDRQADKILSSRIFDPAILQIAIGSLRGAPQGDVTVSSVGADR